MQKSDKNTVTVSLTSQVVGLDVAAELEVVDQD